MGTLIAAVKWFFLIWPLVFEYVFGKKLSVLESLRYRPRQALVTICFFTLLAVFPMVLWRAVSLSAELDALRISRKKIDCRASEVATKVIATPVPTPVPTKAPVYVPESVGTENYKRYKDLQDNFTRLKQVE